MKFFISCLLLVASLNLTSQTPKEIKFPKAKLGEIKTLSDLISDIPKDCKVMSYIFSVKINSQLGEFSCQGGGISSELKVVISNKEKGEWFFIENIKSTCQKSHKSGYKITLE